MIIWLFGVVGLFVMIILIGAHFTLFPWRTVISTAIALGGKAILFNDRFLSFLDILVAIYMISLVFIEGGTMTWICAGYLTYKILVSMF